MKFDTYRLEKGDVWLQFDEDVLSTKKYRSSRTFQKKTGIGIDSLIERLKSIPEVLEYGAIPLVHFLVNNGFKSYFLERPKYSQKYFTDVFWEMYAIISRLGDLLENKEAILRASTKDKPSEEDVRVLLDYRNGSSEVERYSRKVNILSVCVLEAYINEVASEKLSKQELNIFEQNNLRAKWLFLPWYLSNRTFKIDGHPFNTFSQMIADRNRLVHYKISTKKVPFVPASIKAFFAEDIRLLDKSMIHFDNAVQMVRELHSLVGGLDKEWLARIEKQYEHIQEGIFILDRDHHITERND